MKKTAISLLLAVALVFSLVLVAAPAAQATTTHSHCVCCGNTPIAAANHTCDTTQDDWMPLSQATFTGTQANGGLTGKYYLTENVSYGDKQFRPKGELTICLNGFELSFKNFRPQNDQENTLTITDCKGTGSIKSTVTDAAGTQMFMCSNSGYKANTINIWGGTIQGTPKGSTGPLFYMGSAVEGSTHTLNIYGGKIIGSAAGSKDGVEANGGAVCLTQGATCNMYGGSIVNGKAVSTSTGAGQGGNIFIGGAYFNLYGGSISGGTVETPAGKAEAKGGNIFLNGGVLTVNGGTITGGAADIYAAGGKIKINKADTAIKFTVGADFDTEESIIAGTGITVTNNGNVYTAAKTTAGGNVSTGDNANLVVMGLGLVLGVAGMACLLPKKQKV